jgi:hypothetical protein
MKRIDRSSKGHYESETASRIATLGVHNLFEPYSNKLPMQLIAVMLASLFRALDLPAWQWGLSLLSWVPENAFMCPSRLPIQYHRNTL